MGTTLRTYVTTIRPKIPKHRLIVTLVHRNPPHLRHPEPDQMDQEDMDHIEPWYARLAVNAAALPALSAEQLVPAGGKGGDRLANFISTNSISPFVEQHLRDVITSGCEVVRSPSTPRAPQRRAVLSAVPCKLPVG
jgi:hypothetical protein